ncbi:MAG: tetratricopeptide repeat protein [Bacteroidota bacterium]
MKKLSLLLFLCFSGIQLYAQQPDQKIIDSLNKRLAELPEPDTARMTTLIVMANARLGFNASREEKEASLQYIGEAKRIADSLDNKRGKMGVYSFLGLYHSQGGNLSKALDYNLSALKIAEELGRSGEILRINNVIGGIYFSLNDADNALKFFQEALNWAEKINNERQIGQFESNIGIAFHQKKEYGKALDYYTRALRTCEKSKNIRTKAHVLNSMGRLFFDMGVEDEDIKAFDKAINYYNQSLAIKRELKDERGLANTLGNVAVVYKEMGQYDKSLKYYSEGLEIAERLNYVDWLKEGYGGMSELFEAKGDFKNALVYYKKFKTIIDTMQSANVKEEIARLQGQFDSEKKDRQIELMKKEDDLKNARLGQQNMIIYFSVGGLLVVMVFAFFLFRGYKEKQRINLVIEEKNKSITDSIHYARRIQTAILPSNELISSRINDYFIYYRPKDIVSGDFYFFAASGDKTILAVADCTGHGVPGAFMSMIGNSLLNQIIKEKGIVRPADILEHLHTGVKTALQQNISEVETNDGMDIALCAIDPKNKKLEFAGANRGLYLVNAKGLEEVSGDKFPIGGMQSEEQRQFTNHSVSLDAPCTFYLSSDGFADQFGGPEGKKFRTKRFKELLRSISGLPMARQQAELERTMSEWMKNSEQLDDILVVGFRA